mgnify:CR=1 FL=1
MKHLIMIDGNNLLFRSYYATAYSGNFMKNSKNFPTNAIYGLVNMINKILDEEKPNYVIVAFDRGKTFRHEKYTDYKGGRIETPDELKKQFPVAKEVISAMGLKWYDIDNYEADDIIGTFSTYCDNENIKGTIISSDKDLLQLINEDVDVKLLKSGDSIRYNEETFESDYGIKPINIIDLKALMGDSSDNIPGVKGIGEKGALKLLQEYKTLDGIYNNIDKIKGKTKEKLENDKKNAYFSYELATIYKEVPLDIKLEDTYYDGPNVEELNKLYSELEFYSFLKKTNKKDDVFNYQIIDNISLINSDNISLYLECKDFNYFKAKPIGVGIYDGSNGYYMSFDNLIKNNELLNKIDVTYNLKRLYVSLKNKNIEFTKLPFDTMLASYLLEYNTKDDVAVSANNMGYNIPLINELYKNEEDIPKFACLKAKFLYETKSKFLNELNEKKLIDLYENIELPLTIVLGKMEYNGIYVSSSILENMGKEINDKINLVALNIYNLVGHEFNINSPKQLGEVLFDELGLTHGKKNQSGYSTANDVLTKLKGTHPVIDEIIEYRMLTKLYSTYIEGLINSISSDGKIHTIYSQVTARTGRLSSLEPNIQNIPVRYEYGKMIRKAFLPSSNSVILSSDYSQIELRILSSIASIDSMIEAFKNGIDIHTKTAADIFNVDISDVTKDMRRIAKAVNFGIIYGISGYGLSENVGIKPKEAKVFIDNYLNTYPGVKEYMENIKMEAYNNGYVKTLFGRIRTIDELKNTNYMIRMQGERIALNTPIQGTSADIIKKAMIDIDKEFIKRNLKTKMIIQVHDELIFDVPNEEIEIVKKIVSDLMENACKLEVPLKVDIEYADNWYDVK